MPSSWPHRAFRLPWRAPAEIEVDLDDELQFHLDQRIMELTAAGMAPEAARREALRRFGDLEGARAYCRALDRGQARVVRRRDWWAGWRQDLGFALRQLLRAPGFTSIAVLTLALGVGANTAIFSVVHRVLLDPLPYATGHRMVALMEVSVKHSMTILPQREVIDAWRARSKSVEAIEVYNERDVALLNGSETERLSAGYITPTLGTFLGVTPPLGRGFLPEENLAGGAPVAMISYGLWQRRFAGSADVLGTPITINGELRTIVGVMPRDLTLIFMGGGSQRQIWLPLAAHPEQDRVQAMGRLRPGVTAAQASVELTSIEHAIAPQQAGSPIEFDGSAIPPQEMMRGNTRNVLLLLFGVVGVVLLIACANVANLLLARASTRTREFAIRAALGAGRGRLIRQLLTESLCLAVMGGALGLFLAWRGLDLLIALRPDSLSELDDVRLQPIALAWSLGLSLATGLLFGLAPAFFATDRSLGASLKSSAGGSGGHRTSRRLRAVLVVAEVALSVTLLVGAGLLIRTVSRMQDVQLGFEPSGVTDLSLAFSERGEQASASRSALATQVLEQVRRLPGVESAAFAGGVPPKTGAAFGQLEIEGHAMEPGQQASLLGYTVISPGYFALLRQPIRAGTTFPERGDEYASIINEGMAKRMWPGENAVGRRFRMDPKVQWSTVIGVVGDVHIPGQRGNLTDLQLYGRLPSEGMREQIELIVRTRGDLPTAMRGIESVVAGFGSRVRMANVNTVSSMIDGVIAGPRFSMALFVAFAGLALLLATIGLYGVISYSVGQRTREIGVRIALGAGVPSVLRLVVGQGLQLTLAGVALGLLAAVAGTRAMQSLLFEVSALDPVTFGLVSAMLILVSLLASYLPARRAARVDPVIALRSE